MKRRSITLIEVMVSMALFSLLVGAICFWYSHFTEQSSKYEKLRKSALAERYFTDRMERIFSKATLYAEKGLTTFCYENNELIFTFDNGPNKTPQLSDVVLAKLYLDREQQTLCVTLWPQPEEGNFLQQPSKTLLLQDNVESFELLFFHPKESLNHTVAPEKIGTYPHQGWNSEWKAEYQQLPALIKLTINNLDKKTLYSFYLPHPIIYPRESA